MRDGFLWFLMGLAGVTLVGFIVFAVAVCRRRSEDRGCLLFLAAAVTVGIVWPVLAYVGHAVDVAGACLTAGR